MRRKLKELTDTLSEFVDQADYLTLVIGADNASMALIVKTIEGLDEQNASDLFILFPDDAVAPPTYVTACAVRIEAQRTVANGLLAEAGKPQWPPLPAQCLDERHSYELRLGALITYVRERLPEGDHRLIFALLPMTIKDRVGYAQLVGQLVPREPIMPWMRGARFLVRDDRSSPFLIPNLRKIKAPGVLTYQPDFGPAAIEAALAADALDKTVPVPDRMDALLQVASLDYAHQRFPEAIEKYGILFAYYAEHDAKEMQAVCLQGVGDVLRRVGKPAEAKVKYEQALNICADSHALVIVLNLCVASGDVSLELKQLEDAHGYFTLADQIASTILNPFVKADCMEKLGIVHELQLNIGPAVRLWSDASQLCRQFEYNYRLASLLGRLKVSFQAGNMKKELRDTEAELAVVKAKVDSQVKPS